MFSVRPAAPADATRIAAWQVAMAIESEGLALDAATVSAGVAGVFEDTSRARYWLAEAHGVPVGVVMTVPEWSDWRNGTVLWMHSVYVEPAWRQRGAFRALYAHLRSLVEGTPGLVGLRLYVDKTNQRAQRVYEALGMSAEHYHLYEWLP
ncbi:MAG: GNAT family N-acetyltransferase [Chloroflexota bacterium]